MDPQSSGNLAATKLRPPIAPTRLVDRSRLATLLDRADADRIPLVLISAPAGSGKSTLVAGWAAAHQSARAWLQLEESDADPARFWVSLTASIGRANPALAAELEPLVAGSLGAGQVVVPALVNAASSLAERLTVVLDDYHLIDDPEVHRSVERLIDLCPPQLTVVLITRADPPFRLGRMRVRGRVREIRAGDLRFDSTEAAALLGSAADGLDQQRLDDLCDRTEGWAAGLVLAGLSLERSDNSDGFIETFRGDDQLVAGYLTDEFLAVLDQDERRRMVEAAVLHRLSGPLLDSVTGSTDGASWLDRLAASNQLVIRLDAVGEWYRYHHLFRDLLLLEARRSMPDQLPDLHRRAAAWFEAAGYPAAAADHLLFAGDREPAMHLMRSSGRTSSAAADCEPCATSSTGSRLEASSMRSARCSPAGTTTSPAATTPPRFCWIGRRTRCRTTSTPCAPCRCASTSPSAKATSVPRSPVLERSSRQVASRHEPAN